MAQMTHETYDIIPDVGFDLAEWLSSSQNNHWAVITLKLWFTAIKTCQN